MTTNEIGLPGGWTLKPPPGLNLPNLSPPNFSLTQGTVGNALGPPDLSGLLSALAPTLGQVATTATGNPLAGVAIGLLFQIGHALTMQVQANTASGTPNPSLDLVHNMFWSEVLKAFAPHAAPPPAPTTS